MMSHHRSSRKKHQYQHQSLPLPPLQFYAQPLPLDQYQYQLQLQQLQQQQQHAEQQQLQHQHQQQLQQQYQQLQQPQPLQQQQQLQLQYVQQHTTGHYISDLFEEAQAHPHHHPHHYHHHQHQYQYYWQPLLPMVESMQLESSLVCTQQLVSYQAVSKYDGTYFVCIDVECAATGYGHFDQSPCRIAMVDFFGLCLFDSVVAVEGMLDPLSEFTGLSARQINSGKSLKYVLSALHAMLSRLNKRYKRGVTIVGQNVINDIVWTKLQKNVHYKYTIDIAHEFKTEGKHSRRKPHFYSLRQVAYAMDIRMNQRYHSALEDAEISMRLYREWCLDGELKQAAKRRLKRMRDSHQLPDFRVVTSFPQCSYMYSPSRCRCGQASAAHINGIGDIELLRKLYLKAEKRRVLKPIY